MKPIVLLLKSHIDTYTRKDGSVVTAHDDKRAKHKEWINKGRTKVGGYTVHRAANPDEDVHHVEKDGKRVGTFDYEGGSFWYSGGKHDGDTPFDSMDHIAPVLEKHHGKS